MAKKHQSATERNWKILERHYHHYKDLDFCYWEHRANRTVRRIEGLKREEHKHPCYLELYTDYVQLFEVMVINMRAMLSPRLFECLFIGPKELRIKVAELFPSSSTEESPEVDKWVRGLVFHHAVFGRYIVDDAERRVGEYKSMLKEAAQDYRRDYQLLNAFKHGFRTKVSGKNMVAISANGGGGTPTSYVVGQYNSRITYYSLEDKEVDGKKIKVVLKNKLGFNYQRVHQKILYLSNSLERSRRAILYIAKPEGVGKKGSLPELMLMDREKFQDYYGCSRFSDPVYKL